MFEPKYVVRKGTLFNRRMLDNEVWMARNNQVCDFALGFLKEKNIRSLHVFLPIKKNKEVDLWSLIHKTTELGVQVFVSSTDFKEGTMSHHLFSIEMKFEEDEFGIPTPKNAKSTSLSDLEMILIPMLAGDKLGNRVGYGKGYYDRLLTEIPSDLLKVGITLNPLFDQFNFTEEHDVALDYIITPHQIVKCR